MAKLRRNHGSGSGATGFGVSLLRLVVLFGIVLAAVIVLYPYLPGGEALPTSRGSLYGNDRAAGSVEPSDRLFLPTGPSDQVVHHTYYSLGYDEDWEQARWVAYRLTPKHVSDRRVKRGNDFRPDPEVLNGSADREDYRRSGYTRGHLVPAGDMAFDEQAMSETFYYSNISPQLAEHNGAVWRELEETTREWVRDKGPTYIVTGPIVAGGAREIGANGVDVPDAFFKVLLTEGGEGVAFVIPHEVQTAPLSEFAVSIDDCEQATGLDFFPELTQLATDRVEADVDADAWPASSRRYQQRLKSWNKQR